MRLIKDFKTIFEKFKIIKTFKKIDIINTINKKINKLFFKHVENQKHFAFENLNNENEFVFIVKIIAFKYRFDKKRKNFLFNFSNSINFSFFKKIKNDKLFVI